MEVDSAAARLGALILITVACAGCVTSNYDFAALSEVGGHARGARLWQALVLEQEDGHHEELYDIDMIPLVRTHLNVFAESDDEGLPPGFVEADIDAWLPLFGIVDGTVDRYDSDRQRFEHHEFSSWLWGLFQTHREQVDTTVGLREQNVLRLLWLFDWESTPEYVGSTSEVWSP